MHRVLHGGGGVVGGRGWGFRSSWDAEDRLGKDGAVDHVVVVAQHHLVLEAQPFLGSLQRKGE